MKKYTKEIKAVLSNAADEKTKEKVLRLTSGANCYGVSVPQIRALAKSFKQENPVLTVDALCSIMDELCKEKCREEILFGIFLIASFKKVLLDIAWSKIDAWLDALDNWETCDQLSSNVATPIMVKNVRLMDKLKPLAKSPNLWKRRFAAATAASINHGGRQFPDQTLAICQTLIADKEIMVRKAVGWALREISRKAPDMVFDFLKANRKHISKGLMKESFEKLSKSQQKDLIEKYK